jgi:hypothetical protein
MGDICLQEEGFASRLSDCLSGGRGLAIKERGLLHISDHGFRTLTGESNGNGTPNAGSGAGDYGDFVFKTHRHHLHGHLTTVCGPPELSAKIDPVTNENSSEAEKRITRAIDSTSAIPPMGCCALTNSLTDASGLDWAAMKLSPSDVRGPLRPES